MRPPAPPGPPTPVIARVFAESDRGELAHLVGVVRRSLFQFGYDPETWRSPKDAMAQRFYLWKRDARS
ncbi:TcmI family type II polyketide cyclase [Streptomyces sp. NPDC001606]